jgi:hypothetical protein
MAAALPMLVLTLLVEHLTVNTVLMVMMMGIDSRSLTKDINVSLILSDLLGIALTAYMLV